MTAMRMVHPSTSHAEGRAEPGGVFRRPRQIETHPFFVESETQAFIESHAVGETGKQHLVAARFFRLDNRPLHEQLADALALIIAADGDVLNVTDPAAGVD